jgi:hypothetical protein
MSGGGGGPKVKTPSTNQLKVKGNSDLNPVGKYFSNMGARHVADALDIGGDTGKYMKGDWGDVGRPGYDHAAASAGYVDPYQQHVSNQPSYSDMITNDGSYQIQSIDPNQLSGYQIDKLDPSQLQGYEVDKIGEGDIANREYQELGDIEKVKAMSFDPYRRNALQDVDASSASGLASAQGDMARTGGLSAADRMALASQFNRDKIQGRQNALGKYDEMSAMNQYQTGLANANIANDATYWGADQRVANEASRVGNLNDATLWNKGQQTLANQYKVGEQNSQRVRNQKLQTDANKYITGERNNAYVSNVDNQNNYAQDSATRKRQAELDAYNAKKDEWMKKGQIMGAQAQG